jgi:hypothetical protein
VTSTVKRSTPKLDALTKMLQEFDRGGLAVEVELPANEQAKVGWLADRARQACGEAPSCALWVEGRWRGEHDGALTLQVLRAGDAIAAELLSSIVLAEIAQVERGPTP